MCHASSSLSSALSSCYSRVYQSLANLIRWSDQVMLEGVNSDDKETVTSVKGVIKAVLDGVKVRGSRTCATVTTVQDVFVTSLTSPPPAPGSR